MNYTEVRSIISNDMFNSHNMCINKHPVVLLETREEIIDRQCTYSHEAT